MFRHYLKIAFRNLWKYRAQSIISIIGLAIGFTCFSLATLWIRYEVSYDSFHRGADRIYQVGMERMDKAIYRETFFPLANHLKNTFPEIEEAIGIRLSYNSKIEVNGNEYETSILEVDSLVMQFFDIKILEGSSDFLVPMSNKLAISSEFAKKAFGKGNPLGKKISILDDGKAYINNEGEYIISAIVKGWSEHSNFPFQILHLRDPIHNNDSWKSISFKTYIRLVQGSNVEAFREKLYNHNANQIVNKERDSPYLKNFIITPLKSLRHEDPYIKKEIKLQHIVLFAWIGLLVIACSLFNYITLFINRFRIREKELALRIVCGASGRSLFALLAVEFLVTMVIVTLLGILCMYITLSPFRELSDVKLGFSSICLEALVYICVVVSLSLFLFFLLVTVFIRRTLNTVIKKNKGALFRKISIVFQLVICIGFIFCTSVMMKQIYFLHNTDLGYNFRNTASLIAYPMDTDAMENHLRQIPGIIHTTPGCYLMSDGGDAGAALSIFPFTNGIDQTEIPVDVFEVPESFINFYEFQLVEGNLLTEQSNEKEVMVNEALVKAFGWKEAIGKELGLGGLKIIGVIKDFYRLGPTVSSRPSLFQKGSFMGDQVVSFRYQDGTWDSIKEKIEALLKKEAVSVSLLSSANELYDDYFKSENALLKLMGFLSLICIIISVFGFFSLVSLSCEEKRKEIAIRKINGASIHDILSIFLKEYSMLLIIGAVIAFPVGYFIMKRWLEQYVKQTSMDAWIYIAIMLILTLVIVLVVGWRIYKTSRENPSEVIKSE